MLDIPRGLRYEDSPRGCRVSWCRAQRRRWARESRDIRFDRLSPCSVAGDDCVPRQVGENAIVCVCNSTYCDSVTEVQVKKNQYVWYTSTMSGQRLQSTIASFSNEIKPSNLVLTLDSSQKYQTICGFGGAMTDSTALNIRTLSSETQRNLIEYVWLWSN